MPKPPFDPNKPFQAVQSQKPPFDPSKPFQAVNTPVPESTQGEAFIEGVGKGATFGLLPYAQAGTEKVINKIAGFEDTPLSTLVQQYRDRGAQLRADNPWTTGAGEVVGGIAPGAALSKGIAMAGAKILPQAVQNLGYSAQVASNVGPIMPKLNAFGKIAKGASEGAIMAGAYTPDEGAGLDQRLEQAKLGALIGGGIPAAVEGAKAAYSGAKAGIVKGFSALTGVNEDAIKQFYANPQKYLDAPTREQVVERMQTVVNQVHDDIERGAITVQDAKEQLREMATNLKQTRGEASRIARETLRDSERNLNDAYGKMVNELKAKPAPTSLQPQVNEALTTLGESVSDQSSKAFDILKNEKVKLPAYDAYKWLNNKIDTLANGAPSDQSKSLISKLEIYKNYLGPKAELTGEQAKELIMAIDSDVSQWAKQYGKKGLYNETLKGFRGEIDTALKNLSENYKGAMQPLSKDTDLLVRSQKLFGTPDKALAKLSGIANPKSVENQKLLNELGARTGKDFNSPIQDFVETQRLLKSPERLNTLKQGLPQYTENQSALAQAAKAKRLTDSREINRVVNNSVENRSIKVAQESLDKSKAVKAEIPGWTRNNVYKRVGQVMNNMNDPAVQKQLGKISELGGQDFTDMINSLRVNKAFSGERINGSRRAVLGGFAGMSSGNPVLGAVGSATGYLMDKYGPAIAKQTLVALKNIEGRPTVQGIMKAGNLTQKVAQEFINALEKGAPASQSADNAMKRRLIGSQQEDDTYANK